MGHPDAALETGPVLSLSGTNCIYNHLCFKHQLARQVHKRAHHGSLLRERQKDLQMGRARPLRPGLDYAAARRARLTRRQLWGAIIRTGGYIALALTCSAWVRHVDHAWSFAIRVGLVTGLVTVLGTLVNPYIEYYADNLPERRLGVFGIGLVLCGFALQSVQYWLAILDVPVT
jgi:hypothetical protein